MRITLSLLVILIVVAVACDKDKFQTKPTISIKSMTGDYIPLNASLRITLECTDKEGDVQDSIIIIKQRLNKRVVQTLRDTIRIKFPVFPVKPKTEIVLTLDYQNHLISASNPPFIPGSNPPQKEVDTLVLRLAVKDNAGNVSDTITSPQIQVFRQ
jgi:hypothetical protein